MSHVLRFFRSTHLPPHLAKVCDQCNELAYSMAETGEGPELTVGLRKLLEAKDCFVRASLQPGDHHADTPE